MIKYTEGPWRHDNDFRAVKIFDGEERHIATLHGGFGKENDEGRCQGLSHNGMVANANLIAAAPDLLKALENISNGIQTGSITSDYDETLENAVIKANNAILKARGEQ